MPYNILHVVPYMHPSAGGPPVVVENFVVEASRLGHSSEIISTTKFCTGDERSLKARLDQLAPATFFTELETVPFVSRSASEMIDAHVRRADLCSRPYTLEAVKRRGPLCVFAERQTVRLHAARDA